MKFYETRTVAPLSAFHSIVTNQLPPDLRERLYLDQTYYNTVDREQWVVFRYRGLTDTRSFKCKLERGPLPGLCDQNISYKIPEEFILHLCAVA